MAQNDDVSQQLKLTQQLSQAIEEMARNVSKLEEAYKSQTDALNEVAKAMASIKAKELGQNFDGLNTALKKSKEVGDDSTQSLKKMVGQMLKAKVSGQALGKSLGATAKEIAIAAAAWSGMKQGLENFISLGKASFNVFTGVIGFLGDVAASIISIPFKILGGLIDLAAKNANGMNEFAQAVENVRKQFGDLKGPGAGAVLYTTKTLKGFSDTGLSAWRVFGTLAERLDRIREVATAMGSTFSVLQKEFRDNGGAVLAFQKGLGIADENMQSLAARSITMGKPLSKTLLDVSKQSLALGEAFELDQKLIARDMGKATGDVKHFGQATVKEIGQAAVYARKLGIELDKIVGTLDAFETFDSAAENAAKLSQSFGVTVDAFKLMEAQSPAEQIEMLRKQFKLANVDTANFSRQQLHLLSSTTGLDEATAKQAFSLKNQGVGLDAIKKKSEGAQAKTLTQAEAMGKLADSIERMVKSGNLSGSYIDMFIKGILGGLQNTREFWRVITNIQQGLISVYNIGLKLGYALPKLIPELGSLLEGLGDLFEPKKFTKLFNGIKDTIENFLKDPKANFSDVMEKLREKFFDFFDSEKPAAKKILDAAKKMLVKLAKIAGEGIKWVADKIGEGLKGITDFIRDPGKYLKQMGGAAGEATGFLGQFLNPLIDGLKHAWVVLWPAVKELFLVVGHKLVNYLKSDEFLSIIKPALPAIAAVLFGPAFTKAMLTSLLTTAGSGAIKGIAAAGKHFMGAKETLTGVAGVNKAAGGAVNSASSWGAKDAVSLGLKLVAIATALAIGGIEMALAVKGMMAILGKGTTVKDVEAPLLVLGAMVIAAVPLMGALKLAKSIGDPADIAAGGALVALAVGIVGGVGALLTLALKKVASPAELDAASGFMLKMSLVFLAMVPLLAGAMALGTVITASEGFALIPIAAGMAAISVATSSMMSTAMDIVKEVGKLQIDAGFQTKIDAFLGVMKAIQAFAGTMVHLVSMMTPTFTEFLTGTTEKFSEKANSAAKLLKTMIGEKGAGTGIVGIVELVVNSLKDLAGGSPKIIENAKVFADVLGAVASAMGHMTPPPEFFTAGDSLLSHLNGPKPFADLASDVAYYSKIMQEQLFMLLTGDKAGKSTAGGLIPMIKRLGEIARDLPPSDQIQGVAGLLNSLTAMLGAITPSPDLIKAFSKTTTVSGSLFGMEIGPKMQNSKIDTAGMKAFIDNMKDQFQAIVPLLADKTLTSLITLASKPKFSGDSLKKITDVSSALTAVANFSKEVNEHLKPTMQSFALLPSLSKDTLDALDEKGMKNIGDTITRMIQASTQLNAALSKVGPVDIVAKLKPLAASLGMGAKGEFEIKKPDVNVHVNFTVSIDAKQLEQSIVLRDNSFVRQRLDALSEYAGAGPKLGTNNYSPVRGNPPALTKGTP